MIRIELTGSPEKQVERIARNLNTAEDKALQTVAYMMKSEVMNYIESDGGGSFHERSMIAHRYSSSVDRKFPLQLRTRATRRNPMLFLMPYYTWRKKSVGEQKDLDIFFRDSSNPQIDFLIGQVQTGAQITVTEKMRRAFGATDFPLKADTKEINIPAREIGRPVFLLTKSKIPAVLLKSMLGHMRKNVR